MQSQSDQPSIPAYSPLSIKVEVPAVTMTAPRDWTLWMLPAACVMLALSAYILYILPLNFDLLMPLRWGVWIAPVFLAIILFRTHTQFVSTSNNIIAQRPNGKTVVWNWLLPIRGMLISSLAFAGISAFEVWNLLTHANAYYLAHNSQFYVGSLCIASMFALFASFFWLLRLPLINKWLHNHLYNALVLLAVVIVSISFGDYLSIVLKPKTPSIAITSFASWSTVVQIATEEASKYDKGAVVNAVSTDRPYDYGAEATDDLSTIALQLNFGFARPNGGSIQVSVLDTNPPRVVSVASYDGSASASVLSPEALNALGTSFSNVKLGPRDALASGREEALKYSKGGAVFPSSHMMLFIGDQWLKKYGVPAIWGPHYGVEFGSATEPSQTLTVMVDGTSGRIVADNPQDGLIYSP